MNVTVKWLLFVLVLTFPVSKQVYAMSIGFKICLASEASGVVTDNGVPVKGATLTRKVVWNDKEFIETVVTDENGKFSFPTLYDRSLLKYAPITPVMGQEVTISFSGQTHSAWELVKKDWDYLGEVNSGKAIVNNDVRPFIVRCELSSEVYSRHVPGTLHPIHGKCLLEWEDASEK